MKKELECEQCGADIYEGQEYYEFDGLIFDDWQCIRDYLLDTDQIITK